MSIYNSTSPYFNTPVVNNYLDVIVFRNIDNIADDQQYEIEPKYENRPDLLAYDFYNDSRLWWVFAVRNKNIIKDPIYDMVPGTVIYIPKLSYLKSVLGI
jgi:hypothetical protein